ncbi:hypothetical protein HYR69_00210 [Candidatus Sumerlaeota bacterium]|nr:hypothetical protein [Candidatus Sumerlaeota bacterium]
MILPNVEQAIVDRVKVVEYLLDASHPDNAGKAAFFTSFGFNADRWEVLADALRHLAATSEIFNFMETIHGIKYIIDGRMETPSGKTPEVRTIWIAETGGHAPRLVTAYPN